jgi:glycosyltransferase involved in cell wall biosynthesis
MKAALLNILHVITKLDVGGAQSVVAELVREQIKAGHKVTVATGLVWGTAVVPTIEGIRVIEIDSLVHPFSPRLDSKAIRELTGLLKAERFDVVHTHSSKGGLLGRIAARRCGNPSVYTAHGWPFQEGAPRSQRMQSLFGEWVGGRIGDEVVCVNTVELQLAARFRIGRSEHRRVIYNGTAFAEPSVRIMRRPQDPLKLVMVARLHKPKRADIVVEALSLSQEMVSLTIVGDGELKPSLEALVHRLGMTNRVTFAGLTDPTPYLEAADAFVLVSDYEGMPITVLEAMRAGLPIVANDLPGIREAIGVDCGLLTDPTGPAVAEALATLLADPIKGAMMGQAARDRWASGFTAAAMAASYESLYRRVGLKTSRLPNMRTPQG